MSDPINEILEFAGNAATDDIFDLEAYLGAPARLTGHVPGLADQRLENAVLRQLSRFSGGVAQFIAQHYAPGVVDDGDKAKIVAGLETAINALIADAAVRLAPDGGIIDTAEGLAVEVATPPQFDNDTSLATTAFVQRALGNLQGWQQLEAATTLTAAHCGRRINLAGAIGFVTTLPLLASLIPGARIFLSNYGPAVMTIARQGTDLIYAPRESVSAMTSLTLSPGDTVVLESNGGGWILYGGSVALQYASGAFGNSHATNGYQMLPGGLIFQWGAATVVGGTPVTVSIPYALASFGMPAICAGSGSGDVPLGSGYMPSLSTILLNHTMTGSARGVYYHIIGK